MTKFAAIVLTLLLAATLQVEAVTTSNELELYTSYK